jgi:hypothetical protein
MLRVWTVSTFTVLSMLGATAAHAAPPSPAPDAVASQRDAAAPRDTAGSEGAAQPKPSAAETTSTTETGTEWTRSSTGWAIPDPTGSRLFKPAISGGVGVR